MWPLPGRSCVSFYRLGLISIMASNWRRKKAEDTPQQQLPTQLEYTLLKPDCHSWWISKIQPGREDTLEELFELFWTCKNATETYGMLQTAFGAFCINRASVFEWHKRFKEGRESVKDDERCGRSKEVNTPELIGQRVRIRVTMLRF